MAVLSDSAGVLVVAEAGLADIGDGGVVVVGMAAEEGESSAEQPGVGAEAAVLDGDPETDGGRDTAAAKHEAAGHGLHQTGRVPGEKAGDAVNGVGDDVGAAFIGNRPGIGPGADRAHPAQ